MKKESIITLVLYMLIGFWLTGSATGASPEDLARDHQELLRDRDEIVQESLDLREDLAQRHKDRELLLKLKQSGASEASLEEDRKQLEEDRRETQRAKKKLRQDERELRRDRRDLRQQRP